jgi:Ca2+-binding EF-hand superfamily protein
MSKLGGIGSRRRQAVAAAAGAQEVPAGPTTDDNGNSSALLEAEFTENGSLGLGFSRRTANSAVYYRCTLVKKGSPACGYEEKYQVQLKDRILYMVNGRPVHQLDDVRSSEVESRLIGALRPVRLAFETVQNFRDRQDGAGQTALSAASRPSPSRSSDLPDRDSGGGSSDDSDSDILGLGRLGTSSAPKMVTEGKKLLPSSDSDGPDDEGDEEEEEEEEDSPQLLSQRARRRPEGGEQPAAPQASSSSTPRSLHGSDQKLSSWRGGSNDSVRGGGGSRYGSASAPGPSGGDDDGSELMTKLSRRSQWEREADGLARPIFDDAGRQRRRSDDDDSSPRRWEQQQQQQQRRQQQGSGDSLRRQESDERQSRDQASDAGTDSSRRSSRARNGRSERSDQAKWTLQGLRGHRLPQLAKMAEDAGIDVDSIDDAMDSESPKQDMIKLMLSHLESTSQGGKADGGDDRKGGRPGQDALGVPSKEERDRLFRRMDNNGSGTLSLAEIDKAVVELFPGFNHKPALMRAYKAADKTGDGFVGRREFRLLIKYLVYFNNLWDKFEEIDRDGDRRLTCREFFEGTQVLGVDVGRAEAEREFEAMDENKGGYVLFDEFCAWCAERHVEGSIGELEKQHECGDSRRKSGGASMPRQRQRKEDRSAKSTYSRDDRGQGCGDGMSDEEQGAELRAKLSRRSRWERTSDNSDRASEDEHRSQRQASSRGKGISRGRADGGDDREGGRPGQDALGVPSKEERDRLFRRMDNNGSGTLSLAEIDKAVVELFPGFNHKPALMRAYKAADKTGDGFVGRREFRLLIKYLVYFNNLWDKFEEIDRDGDRRLTCREFFEGTQVLGVDVGRAEAEREFEVMDENKGGYVLFDEFCAWCAERHVEGDGEDGRPQARLGDTDQQWGGGGWSSPVAMPSRDQGEGAVYESRRHVDDIDSMSKVSPTARCATGIGSMRTKFEGAMDESGDYGTTVAEQHFAEKLLPAAGGSTADNESSATRPSANVQVSEHVSSDEEMPDEMLTSPKARQAWNYRREMRNVLKVTAATHIQAMVRGALHRSRTRRLQQQTQQRRQSDRPPSAASFATISNVSEAYDGGSDDLNSSQASWLRGGLSFEVSSSPAAAWLREEGDRRRASMEMSRERDAMQKLATQVSSSLHGSADEMAAMITHLHKLLARNHETAALEKQRHALEVRQRAADAAISICRI